jgi:hypothetical protein
MNLSAVVDFLNHLLSLYGIEYYSKNYVEERFNLDEMLDNILISSEDLDFVNSNYYVVRRYNKIYSGKDYEDLFLNTVVNVNQFFLQKYNKTFAQYYSSQNSDTPFVPVLSTYAYLYQKYYGNYEPYHFMCAGTYILSGFTAGGTPRYTGNVLKNIGSVSNFHQKGTFYSSAGDFYFPEVIKTTQYEDDVIYLVVDYKRPDGNILQNVYMKKDAGTNEFLLDSGESVPSGSQIVAFKKIEHPSSLTINALVIYNEPAVNPIYSFAVGLPL